MADSKRTKALKSTGIVLSGGRIVYTDANGKLCTILSDGRIVKTLTPNETDNFLKIRKALASW